MKNIPISKNHNSFGWFWVWQSVSSKKIWIILIVSSTIGAFLSGLVLPIFAQHVIDSMGLIGVSNFNLTLLGVGAAMSIGAEAVLGNLRQRFSNKLAAHFELRLLRKLYIQLLRIRTDYQKVGQGEILVRFQQVSKLKSFALQGVPSHVFNLGGAAVSLALMFYYDTAIGASVGTITITSVLFMKTGFGNLDGPVREHSLLEGKRHGTLNETLSGLETIRSLALEGSRLARWNTIIAASIASSLRIFELAGRQGMVSQTISRLLMLVVLAIGCIRISQGALTVGELVALQVLVMRVSMPILMGGDMVRQFKDASVSMSQLASFFDQPRELPTVRPGIRSFGSGAVLIDHLEVTYQGAARPALEKFNLSLPPRGVIAIVGKNGSGKSTLLRVLLGIHRDFKGDVKIGATEIRAYDPRWLRRQVSTVDQETVLFSGSVRENILAGRIATDEQVGEALEFAAASAFVQALPSGLDTELKEGGRGLSGGQRQRLAIARAVLRQPRIALLDEPTAFLDAEAAVSLERKLIRWGEDRLVLLVTHHLHSARNATRIVVLDEGRIVGDGRHDGLVEECVPYRELWDSYIRSNEGENQDLLKSDQAA